MSDSIACDATIMNSSHSEAFDEPGAAGSSVETTANLFSDSGADQSNGHFCYQQRKRDLEEQLQLLDSCRSAVATRDVLLRMATICKPPGGYARHEDIVKDDAFREFVVAAFDLEMRTKLTVLLLKRPGNSEDDVIMYDVTVVLPVMRLINLMFHCASSAAGGASNQKLATVRSGMLRIVLDRMLTISDTETFSACLVFVQNSFNNEDCGGGDRQLEPVARELVDKCLFMLNLASDEADDAACATILRFFVRSLDEQSVRRHFEPFLFTKILHACALLLQSFDRTASLQVVELSLVCILKLFDSMQFGDWRQTILVDDDYVPLIMKFVTHERDVIRHRALAIVAEFSGDAGVMDFVQCQLLARLGYYCMGADDETISRLVDTIIGYCDVYASCDLLLRMTTDFHVMPHVMTLLESHSDQTVLSSLRLTEEVINSEHGIMPPSLSNTYVIKILQLFTARLEEETHQNLGTDMSNLEALSESCFDLLVRSQEPSPYDDVCVPEEDGDDIATCICLKRLRNNLKNAAKNAVFRDLFRSHDLTDWRGLINDVLIELDPVEEFESGGELGDDNNNNNNCEM